MTTKNYHLAVHHLCRGFLRPKCGSSKNYKEWRKNSLNIKQSTSSTKPRERAPQWSAPVITKEFSHKKASLQNRPSWQSSSQIHLFSWPRVTKASSHRFFTRVERDVEKQWWGKKKNMIRENKRGEPWNVRKHSCGGLKLHVSRETSSRNYAKEMKKPVLVLLSNSNILSNSDE